MQCIAPKETCMLAHSRRPAAAAAMALGLVAGLSGCARIRGHQGYVMDNALVASISPGVDNRDSVQRLLGDPSLAGEFKPDTWYYVSRTTKQFSFIQPKPTAQTVLAVHFDRAGNVASVERTGLEQIASIHPVREKTPTLGRKRSLIQELFGNIGAVGSAGQTGPTADNPNASRGP
jgi:outer membrane protein assembly factor BamE (lipoprotein component of BamABCDE complex)